MTDDEAAAHIGCSADQVRVMRLHNWRCDGCEKVHCTYPSIVAYHSPCCSVQGRCATCAVPMPELRRGHELGLICATCYG